MTPTDDELYTRLMTAAFRFLSIRSRSEVEIANFLSKKALVKSIPSRVVSRVSQRLKELEYINDHKFAREFVSSRLHGKPKGERVIRSELKQKGVNEDIINAVVAESPELGDIVLMRELAVKALGRKLSRYTTFKREECSRKLYDFVIRRGFSASVARSLVDDYCKKAYNRD